MGGADLYNARIKVAKAFVQSWESQVGQLGLDTVVGCVGDVSKFSMDNANGQALDELGQAREAFNKFSKTDVFKLLSSTACGYSSAACCVKSTLLNVSSATHPRSQLRVNHSRRR